MDSLNRNQVSAEILANDNHIDSHSQRRSVMVKYIMPLMLVSLLATCQPSYAIAPNYKYLKNHSFNYVDVVAVSGNNDKQELRKLSVSVSHRTIADVFLCLSFASLPFVGELRLALALVRLWWGGHGNKPFIRQIPCAVLQRFSNLPTALTLGQSSKNLPFEKVL